MQVKERARAKLNLSLDILGRMPNGYHEMSMILQTVELCDEITVCVEPGEGIHVRTNLRFLPSDGRNIAAKAAGVFYEAAGIRGFRTDIRLEKAVPVCAGLAGGSSDAAAVLRALNALHATGFSPERLESIGEGLGSDVPFCVQGGTVYASGKGEKLRDLPALPHCFAVICKPAFSISTTDLFSRVNWRKIRVRPNTRELIAALEEGSLAKAARRMYNVFEDVLPERYGEIGIIKQRLLELGALGASMTGTGSAVFGLFDDKNAAGAAFKALKREYQECFLTESAPKAPPA